MSKKQTAVDYLVEKLIKLGYLHSENYGQSQVVKKVIEQAKEMEKEQMSRIYEGLLQNVGTSIKQSDLPTFEQYYNETFKSE